jgi:hypothetical protein
MASIDVSVDHSLHFCDCSIRLTLAQFDDYCKSWIYYHKHEFEHGVYPPPRLLDIQTIGGDHRRVASNRLFSDGDLRSGTPKGQAQFSDALTKAYWRLTDRQARELGDKDNTDAKVEKGQDVGDWIFVVTRCIDALDVRRMMDDHQNFRMELAILRSLSYEQVITAFPHLANQPVNRTEEDYLLKLMSSIKYYDRSTCKIMQPLASLRNMIDLRKHIYNMVLQVVNHTDLNDLVGNTRKQRAWKTCVRIAFYGNRAVTALSAIDELFKTGAITFTDINPRYNFI